jgi:hypothetical protein
VSSPGLVEQFKLLKELLDMGAITTELYEKKAAELLDRM